MKKLAKKLLDQKRAKAAEMVGVQVTLDVNASDKVTTRAISIDEKKHQATFVMSTVNVDRHGDIVDQMTWMLDHFNKNPYFAFQHRSNEFPLGKWVKVWLENDPDNIGEQRLVGTAEFRVEFEDAARAWAHVVAGDMNMVSVGFIPHRVEYDEEKDCFKLYDCELMECSLVGIGSNRQALVKTDETDDVVVEEVRQSLITHSEILDELNKADTTKVVSSRLKAQSHIHKAIRLIGK